MKNKKTIIFILLILSASILVSCKDNGNNDIEETSTLIPFDKIKKDSFEKYDLEEIVIEKKDYTKLDIPESEILKEAMLNILYVENDKFYGYGFGPSDDGTKNQAFFEFDFNGEHSEDIVDKNNENSIMVSPNLTDLDNEMYHYMDISYDPDIVKRYDWNNKNLEDFIELDAGNKYGNYKPIYVNENYFYYQDSTHQLKRVNLEDKSIEDVTPDFMKDNDNLFFDMVNGENNSITFFREYDRNKKTSDIYLMDLNTLEYEKILENRYLYLATANEKYAIFGDYDMETTVIYDLENREFISHIKTEEPYEMIGLVKDKYLVLNQLAKSFDQKEFILIVDLEEKNITKLDIRSIFDENESRRFKLFWHENTLYIQWMGTFDDEDGNIIQEVKLPDNFYRINLELFK